MEQDRPRALWLVVLHIVRTHTPTYAYGAYIECIADTRGSQSIGQFASVRVQIQGIGANGSTSPGMG
jgi:hypothetical protein